MDDIALAGESTLQELIKLLTDYRKKLAEERIENEKLTAQIETVTLELQKQITAVTEELKELKETFAPLKSEYQRLLIKTAAEKIKILALDSQEITKLNLKTTNEKILKAIEIYTTAMEVDRARVERERSEFEKQINDTIDEFKIVD